mgnify:CR=1 FL=1
MTSAIGGIKYYGDFFMKQIVLDWLAKYIDDVTEVEIKEDKILLLRNGKTKAIIVYQKIRWQNEKDYSFENITSNIIYLSDYQISVLNLVGFYTKNKKWVSTVDSGITSSTNLFSDTTGDYYVWMVSKIFHF